MGDLHIAIVCSQHNHPIELFFRLEADRMVNAVLRGWEAQRFTVLEQFFVLQRNDTGRFMEALNGVTGLAHPIYIHTGGHQRDHAYWNRATMLRMYDDYIVPNNATLTLVGDTFVSLFLTTRADLECPPYEHGTVAFPRWRGGNVEQLCELLRDKYETSVVPGRFFEVPEHFRIGIGIPTDMLREGLARLGAALDEMAGS